MIPVAVRLNPYKIPEDGFPVPQAVRPVPWSPYGYVLSERPSFTMSPLFHAGSYYVQDSSAMFVGHVFRKALGSFGPGVRVLDLCAAPGGKTTDLATSLRLRFGDDWVLVSNEVMKDRVQALDDNVARWGDPRVMVTSVDPAAFARLKGAFDIIVADVPCSGEGMFRKDAGAVEQWSPELVDVCAARQRRILADVWPALREGGVLVYSTCTYEDAENDANLEWAAEHLGGELIPPEDEFPEYGVKLTRCGSLLRAGEVPGEGQWAGALVKTDASVRMAKNPDFGILKPLRPVFAPGSRRGTVKGRDFVPDADWALSLDYDMDTYPCAELDRQTALQFLHRDTICLPEAPLGYNVVTYRGMPLGFVKNLGRRCNNLLPRGRRILMDVNIQK